MTKARGMTSDRVAKPDESSTRMCRPVRHPKRDAPVARGGPPVQPSQSGVGFSVAGASPANGEWGLDGRAMLIGVLSDSHGRADVVRRVMGLFDERGVEAVIHCGDVGGMAVFDELVGRACHFVWGNCDSVDGGMAAYLRTVGLRPPDAVPLRATLGGKRFAVFHGHEREAMGMETLVDVDYCLHGHTHVRRDERVRAMRIINPGALFRVPVKTAATLDTDRDELTWYELV